jgi:succinate dehydrogenase cytochrome b556 subunit
MYSRRLAGRTPNVTLAAMAWYFIRVSGMLMLVLVLGHLFIMHYLNAPASTNSTFVAERWGNLLWRSFDWMLLILALIHGVVGLQNVVSDYLPTRMQRLLSGTVMAILLLIFFVLGSMTIVTFASAQVDSGRGALSGQGWIVDVLSGLLVALATVTYLGLIGLAVYIGRRFVQGGALGVWRLPGQWAWALHRLTGVGILGFLLIHVLDIMLLPLAPDVYNQTVASYAHPYLLPMEVALVMAVLYHALNGIRLMVMEFWNRGGRKLQRRLFFAVVGVTICLLLPSVVVLLRSVQP